MRWSHGTPHALRPFMCGALLSSPGAVILGAVNGLFLATLAHFTIGGPAFAIIIAIETMLLFARLVSLKRVSKIRSKGETPGIDTPITLSILWCALQGALFFFSMRSGNTAMMVLVAAHCMGLVGPLCARNYAAPRLGLLLVALCVGPFLAGAASTGEPLMLALLALLPGFLIGSVQLLAHYRSAMLSALSAEMINAERARRDPLTGLLNRHGLEGVMKSLSRGEVFSLVCFDLDGFKPINDRFGHAAGDDLLCEVANRMQSALAEGQVLARIGGDEFLVLLPGQGAQAAETVIQAVLAEVSGAPYAADAKSLVEIGVTAGFACYPDDATNIAELHVLADRALYAAKRAGKGIGTRYAPTLAA
ncbi:sensor domain-containing diguanylate cyclase [Alteriqipengyuania lutimaris]|uniref:GGDEF domain-containing protein n=1 Tax=Alteriqipengyuania lutimaris TaxID=1538146 RepID=UPI001CFCAA3C|nr:GGDEF domain-containing protein [Alteriqipengyuania lutimaris]